MPLTYRQIQDSPIAIPVLSITNTPPGSPSLFDRYLIDTSPTGVWATKAGNIAEWNGIAWIYLAPFLGLEVFNDQDTTKYIYYGGVWNSQAVAALAGLPIGIPFPLWDHLSGSALPSPASKYILLTKDLTGSGQYNENKLTGQSSVTTSEQKYYTAVINDSASPFYLQTVILINSTEDVSGTAQPAPAVISAAETSGNFRVNQFQDHEHEIQSTPGSNGYTAALVGSNRVVITPNGMIGKAITLSGFGTPRTGKTTEQNNVTAKYYMRIKN